MKLGIISAAALLSSTAYAAPDRRAIDAADAFSSLCLSVFIGKESAADSQRFEVTELDDTTKRQIKPDIGASTLWDVHAKISDASMLVHYEPQGLCVVELAEADEKSVQEAVAQVASAAAGVLGKSATAQPVTTRRIERTTATTASWRFGSPKGDVLVMLTTTPEPKFMVQHVMTASYVR
jgi:hypothetical protein